MATGTGVPSAFVSPPGIWSWIQASPPLVQPVTLPAASRVTKRVYQPFSKKFARVNMNRWRELMCEKVIDAVISPNLFRTPRSNWSEYGGWILFGRTQTSAPTPCDAARVRSASKSVRYAGFHTAQFGGCAPEPLPPGGGTVPGAQKSTWVM